MSRPIFGSIDRNEWSSLVVRLDPLVRRMDPPVTLLLEPTAIRNSRLVLLVLGGGFVVRARLTDLERVTGVRLVERDRHVAEVVGGRLPDRCFMPEAADWLTLFLRVALQDRSCTFVLVQLDDRPRTTGGGGCSTGTGSGDRKDC